jgi:hypothetical protein
MREVKRLRVAIAAYAHSDDPLIAGGDFVEPAMPSVSTAL